MIRKTMFVLFCLVSLQAANPGFPVHAGNPVVQNVKIEILGGTRERKAGLESMAKKMTRRLIGKELSSERLDTTVSLLKQTRQFSSIDIPDQDWDAAAVTLVFRLTPTAVIREIKVSGAFPIFSGTVIKASGYAVGSAFTTDSTVKATQTVKSLMADRGYPGADVRISDRTLEALQKQVLIEINKGLPLIIDRIEINGNHSFSDTLLKMKLSSYPVFPFSWITKKRVIANEVTQDVKTLTAFYRKKGFAEVSVSHSIDTTASQNTAILTFQVQEGPFYRVFFSGNQAFWTRTLKKDLTIFTKGNRNDFGIKRSIKNIETRYHNAGYTDCQVSYSTDTRTENGLPIKEVRISIVENERQESPPGNSAALPEPEDRMEVGHVRFHGLPDRYTDQVLRLVESRQGVPFSSSMVDRDRIAVLSFLAEKGFIYARVDTDVTPAGNEYTIDFHITSNSRARIGGVFHFGNFITRDDVILRHNQLHEGDPVSLNRYIEFQNDLRSLQCIEQADVRALGIQETLDQVFFIADIREKKPWSIEAGFGYNSAKDGYAIVTAGDRNLLGTNRELTVNAEISGIGYDTGATLRDFDFMSKHILADVNVHASEQALKNQNFGTREYGTSLSLEKDLTPSFKAGTQFGLESKTQYALSPAVDTTPDLYTSRTIASVTPFITWHSVDSLTRPSRGLHVNLSASYNQDIKNNLDHFIKYRVRARYYIQPHDRLVLAFQGMYGFIQDITGGSRLPDDQLFFLGGISDVRGIGENELAVDRLGNPAGGRTQIAGSVEARIKLGEKFEIPVFLDAGSLRQTRVPGTTNDFTFTIGSGLRYITPVGPVGLLYGFRLNPEPGRDKGRLHFSIGYTF